MFDVHHPTALTDLRIQLAGDPVPVGLRPITQKLAEPAASIESCKGMAIALPLQEAAEQLPG